MVIPQTANNPYKLRLNVQSKRQQASDNRDVSCQPSLTTLKNRSVPIQQQSHSPLLLAYAAELSYGSWEKEGSLHCVSLPFTPQPASVFLMIPPSSQPRTTVETKISSMRASCPPLPRCSGSHTGLLAQEPAQAQFADVPPTPTPPNAALSHSLFQGYCYYKDALGP